MTLQQIAEGWARRLGAQGLTMKAACASAQVNEPTISMWKNNPSTDIDVELIRSLIDVVGLDAVYHRLRSLDLHDEKRISSVQIFIKMEYAVRNLTPLQYQNELVERAKQNLGV